MEKSHLAIINEIRRYIRDNCDQPLDRATLASMAGYSEVHFHRLFTAYVGETLTMHIRRMRMTQAARRLRITQDDITMIAFDSGYETHAAFTKVFKRFFAVSPSQYRKMNPTAAAHLITRRLPVFKENLNMQPNEIVTLNDKQVLYARATEVMTSPAFQTANIEASNMLMGYLERNGLFPRVTHMIAIYPDPAEVGQAVRFDFGAILADGPVPTLEEGLAWQTLPAGRWAMFEHVGPYDTLWQTYAAIYRDWLPTSGEALRNDSVCFEEYVDNPNEVLPEELRTEIYIPIE